MRLVKLDMAGTRETWVNPDHVVSVTAGSNGGAEVWEAADDDSPWHVTTSVDETVRRLMGVRKLPDDDVAPRDGHAPLPVVSMDLDLTDWTRWAEAREYARRRGTPISRAIRDLVNVALSTYDGVPLTQRGSRP